MSRAQKPRTTARNGGGRLPVDPKTRKRAVELATTPDERGKRRSRNAIAKLLGISTSTVSKILAEDGPEGFSWTATAAKVAQEVAVLDAKARRQKLAGELLDDLDAIRARFFDMPMERTAFSVALGVTRWESPATPNELKDLAIAFGVLVDKHLVLVKADTDDRDLNAVDAWIEAMSSAEVPT